MLNRFTLFFMMVGVLICVSQSYTNAQDQYTILEDDQYNFSVMTPAIMTFRVDTFSMAGDVHYTVYDGSYVNELDTMYYRIDVWENPEESTDTLMQTAESMLDSTMAMVGQLLQGEVLYSEAISRNAWPARLTRYVVPTIRRQAKVLLVRRLHRYYLLTVVTSPGSIHHDGVNRFLHSFKLYE